MEKSIFHYNWVLDKKTKLKTQAEPLFFNCLVNLGIAYQTFRSYEDAVEVYQRAHAIQP